MLSLGRSEIQLARSSRVPQALVEDVVIVPQGPQEAGDEGTEVEVVGDSDSLGKSKRVKFVLFDDDDSASVISVISH